MAIKDIITQSDLLTLNEELQKIAANLKLHINESLSIAHGLNAVVADYYDNGGDKFGNVVLIFDFGIPPNVVRLYVPAQLTTLDGNAEDSGLISSGSPSGSNLSPGIPLGSKPLVTELASDSANQSEIYTNILLAHASSVISDTGAAQCHGGVSYTAGNVLDEEGHYVGRRYITIGVNGLAWRIPADPNDVGGYGPPQKPRFVTPGPTVFTATFGGPTRGNFALYPNYYLEQSVDGGEPWPDSLTLEAQIEGSSLCDYEWQYSLAATGPWSAYTIGVAQPPVSGCGWVGVANVSGTMSLPGTLSTQFVLQTPGGDNSGTWYTRLKLDNSGIGGGIVYSPVTTVHMKDESGGSWLCTVACRLGYVTYDEYRADLRYTRKHVPRVYREGYALWALPLSKFLLNHRWPRPLIMPFVRAWTWHMAHKDGSREKDSLLGKVVFNVVKPLCGIVGSAYRAYYKAVKLVTGKNPPPFSRPTLRIWPRLPSEEHRQEH